MRSRSRPVNVYHRVRRAHRPRIGAVTRLAPIVLVVSLLAASAAAFAYAQRAKLEESPIQNIRFDRRLLSPTAGAREVPIRFRLLNKDHVTVDIVDSNGVVVREQLLSGRYEPKSVLFSWDGRDGRGRVVADGLYRLRIALEDAGRTLEVPDEIRVDGTAPTIENVEIRPRVISPDGDRRTRPGVGLLSVQRAAYAVLYVDWKRRPGSSFLKRPAGVLQWYGRGLALWDAPARTGRAGSSGKPVAFDARVRGAGAFLDSGAGDTSCGPARASTCASRPIARPGFHPRDFHAERHRGASHPANPGDRPAPTRR